MYPIASPLHLWRFRALTRRTFVRALLCIGCWCHPMEHMHHFPHLCVAALSFPPSFSPPLSTSSPPILYDLHSVGISRLWSCVLFSYAQPVMCVRMCEWVRMRSAPMLWYLMSGWSGVYVCVCWCFCWSWTATVAIVLQLLHWLHLHISTPSSLSYSSMALHLCAVAVRCPVFIFRCHFQLRFLWLFVTFHCGAISSVCKSAPPHILWHLLCVLFHAS